MNLHLKFTANDLGRIKAAVKETESKISGEIVPVVVEKSADYLIAKYKAALFSILASFPLLILAERYFDFEIVRNPTALFLIVTLLSCLGVLLTHLSQSFFKLFISQSHMDLITRLQAESAFLEEEVFSTRHRTGIMIFVSLFEKEVIIMADRGISKVVDQQQWDRIVSDLIEHLRKDQLVEGLVKAIYQCGEILLRKGFNKVQDDVNEIRDDLRIS